MKRHFDPMVVLITQKNIWKDTCAIYNRLVIFYFYSANGAQTRKNLLHCDLRTNVQTLICKNCMKVLYSSMLY